MEDYKTIIVSPKTKDELEKLRTQLEKKKGGTACYDEVIQSLISRCKEEGVR